MKTRVASANVIVEKYISNGRVRHFDNDMILSTLSISSHGFALGFSKRPRTNGEDIL